MSDLRTILERGVGGATPPPDGFERMLRRRDRKRRNQRIGAGALAIVLALVSFVALTRAFRGTERPADEPTPRPEGIFSEVGGWIAYGNAEGIWAMNPTPGGTPSDPIQLSERPGEPLAWSSDGSKLLFSNRRRGLFVLHSDGSETRLVRDVVQGASFSPDGTTVVFSPGLPWTPTYLDPGIYLIDADGGVPRLLLAASRRYFPEEDRSYRTGLSFPTFSPDGSQIAYIDGMGDWGNSLRVMNADASDVHVLDGSDVHLLESGEAPNGTGSVRSLGMHPNGLSWSPDGTQLAVGLRNDGISVVDADGSGLTLAIPDGRDPYWSPDGTRLSYRLGHLSQNQKRWVFSPLVVASADGTQVVEFGYAESGPWNPLPLFAQGDREATATVGGSGAAPLVYAIVVLGAVGVLVIAWRARRRIAAR